jgi:AcrR family transcriptional regulator
MTAAPASSSSSSPLAASSDGRVARGERTRAAVLARAADIASVDGLDGLSIGRLAADLSVSKAGVFAHFGSKEELQLATVRAAADRFTEAVIVPAFAEPEGLDRLVALCERWLDYSRRDVFPGGCFFFSVAAEYDAKPGRVRDEIAAVRRRWLGAYEQLVAAAQARGELDDAVDPTALAFELDALGMAANLHAHLCDDRTVYDRVRAAMLARVGVAGRPRPS